MMRRAGGQVRRVVATWGCPWQGPWARGTWGRDTLVLRLEQERPGGDGSRPTETRSPRPWVRVRPPPKGGAEPQNTWQRGAPRRNLHIRKHMLAEAWTDRDTARPLRRPRCPPRKTVDQRCSSGGRKKQVLPEAPQSILTRPPEGCSWCPSQITALLSPEPSGTPRFT